MHTMDPTFLRLSSALTGFTESDLTGTGLAEAYHWVMVDRAGGEAVGRLLGRFTAAEQSAEADPELLHEALDRQVMGDPEHGPLARNLVRLWYVGIWQALPDAWHERYGSARRSADATFVPAPDSYARSLIWRTAGAPPRGAQAPGFGSWARAPQHEWSA
ncbi:MULTISPECIES: hypothetical protein [Streptomyces]|uniref:hypothetical protein n=1 Tax=Streptomyces TaxID=1883 RepID=UPI003428B3D2